LTLFLSAVILLVWLKNKSKSNMAINMTNSTLTAYTVTCVCELSNMTTVAGCKTWKQAAKKAESIQDIEVTSTFIVETDWLKLTEDDCSNYDNGEWEVTQKAEIVLAVQVKATDWKQAATEAFTKVQDDLEIISESDFNVIWRRVTEDMVD
jgi:hypothetical protein